MKGVQSGAQTAKQELHTLLWLIVGVGASVRDGVGFHQECLALSLPLRPSLILLGVRMLPLLTLSLLLRILRRKREFEWRDLFGLIFLAALDLVLGERSSKVRQGQEGVVEVQFPYLVWYPLHNRGWEIHLYVHVHVVKIPVKRVFQTCYSVQRRGLRSRGRRRGSSWAPHSPRSSGRGWSPAQPKGHRSKYKGYTCTSMYFFGQRNTLKLFSLGFLRMKMLNVSYGSCGDVSVMLATGKPVYRGHCLTLSPLKA